ncbi:MAG TPA: hypothetical protein VNH64_01135 [Parvularculaceae bacterium]|nr:hypothetical protein [Parvularculaceae bacterium]
MRRLVWREIGVREDGGPEGGGFRRARRMAIRGAEAQGDPLKIITSGG